MDCATDVVWNFYSPHKRFRSTFARCCRGELLCVVRAFSSLVCVNAVDELDCKRCECGTNDLRIVCAKIGLSARLDLCSLSSRVSLCCSGCLIAASSTTTCFGEDVRAVLKSRQRWIVPRTLCGIFIPLTSAFVRP